jgi:hypothetical protein
MDLIAEPNRSAFARSCPVTPARPSRTAAVRREPTAVSLATVMGSGDDLVEPGSVELTR